MKKNIVAIVILLTAVFAILLPAQMIMAGDLGCGKITGCDGSASCGTPGTHSGCKINCEDGVTIYCPEAGLVVE
jgi:hypothetical protein